MRRAWRGRSSRARLEGLEPAGKACRVDQAIGRRRGRSRRAGAWPQVVHRELGRRNGCAGGFFAYFTRGLLSSGKNMRLSQSLKEGRGRPAALSDPVSLGHGTRRRHLHHQPPRRSRQSGAGRRIRWVEDTSARRGGHRVIAGPPPHGFTSLRPSGRKQGGATARHKCDPKLWAPGLFAD